MNITQVRVVARRSSNYQSFETEVTAIPCEHEKLDEVWATLQAQVAEQTEKGLAALLAADEALKASKQRAVEKRCQAGGADVKQA